MIQLQALAAAAVVTLAAAVLLRVVSGRARGQARRARAVARGRPYILYFAGEGCTVCRTHQDPALRALEGIPVEKVDAIAEPELARRFRVLTLPTTIVVDAAGRARHVNYGYAPAKKLSAQLAGL